MAAFDEFIRGTFETLDKIIFRDLMYAIGGVTVMGSLLYTFKNLPGSSLGTFLDYLRTLLQRFPLEVEVYVVLLAYILGYFVQEFFSLIPGCVTTAYKKPNCFEQTLVRWFEKNDSRANEWKEMPDRNSVTLEKLWACVDSHACPVMKNRLERIINLKQVASTMGASFLAATIFLTMRVCKTKEWLDGILAVSLLLFTIGFIFINRIKTAQQSRLEFVFNRDCATCKGSANKKPKDQTNA